MTNLDNWVWCDSPRCERKERAWSPYLQAWSQEQGVDRCPDHRGVPTPAPGQLPDLIRRGIERRSTPQEVEAPVRTPRELAAELARRRAANT